MRILIAHNYYQQPGGEDVVFEAEAALLEQHGHEITRYIVRNDQIEGMSPLKLAAATLWNGAAHRELRDIVRAKKIELAHFHNTFPLISPAAYSAAREEGAAVVQTLHNHRLACLNAVLCRDHHACLDCVGRKVAWPGIRHKCYRGSRSATAVVALMQVTHRAAGTWQKQVDAYIAPSSTTRDILCRAGLPRERVTVKPHFVDPDPGVGDGSGGYAVFVGRLSEEKGLATLLKAWSMLDRPPTLKVIGDGPLVSLVQPAPPNVEWLGRMPATKVYDIMGGAAVVVFPSQGYETFGRVIAEAFAKGTPVIASNLGPSTEMITPGVNGLLFEPGNAEELAARLREAFAITASMRAAARREYEEKYHASANYTELLAIYDRALLARHGRQGGVHHDELGRRASAGLSPR